MHEDDACATAQDKLETTELDLTCEERLSDSPFVELVWRSSSERAGPFSSMAEIHSGIVVTKYQGRTTVTIRGPESRATPANSPAGAEHVGILFKPGTFMPLLPPARILDRHDVNLPETTSQSFWLHGSAWQPPDFENADTFVDRLAHEGLLAHDPVIGTVLRGEPVHLTPRTIQRHFLRATGLAPRTLRQIERARYATTLLKQGLSILDTVYEAGYYDQPHLTRSLRHFVGLTPAQLINTERSESLSFLYKATPFLLNYDTSIR